MGKQLIIVESPAKVKTIKKFLGPQYMVQASVGHVRDLPSSSLGVDEANDFAPQYEIIDNKKNVVSELRSAAAKADTVYLAPDPDREGEAIAWHVAELIRDKAKDIKRIQFNEITARAVKEALAHPRELNQHLFDAQQARRVLDRLVGYKLSPPPPPPPSSRKNTGCSRPCWAPGCRPPCVRNWRASAARRP